MNHTGISVYIESHKPKTLAFRCDIDALAILEENNVSYKSKHQGVMHACGHDGHTAAMLGFLRRIKNQSLRFNVIAIFQNSEECGSGAKEMSQYILSKYKINAIFAFHIMPLIQKHHIVSSSDNMMYASEEINIKIKGKQSHVGMRALGIDSIKIASQLIFQYATLDHENFFIHIGEIKGGKARNIVCDEVCLKGTLRAKSEKDLKELKNRISFIHRMMNKQYHVFIHTDYLAYYPPVINDCDLYKRLSDILPLYKVKQPYMLSEDFSYYQKHIPSVFMFIGTGLSSMLHTSRFDFDESILITIVNSYEKILYNL